jgi:hypothetical protein
MVMVERRGGDGDGGEEGDGDGEVAIEICNGDDRCSIEISTEEII